MAELIDYGLCIRMDGPGTQPRLSAPTAGTLAMVIQQALACHTPDQQGVELLPPQFPLTEVLVDITPMIALCKITRVLDDPDEYVRRTNELWSFFGVGMSLTVQSVLDGQRKFRDEITAGMFGTAPDMAALTGIDVSGMPMIVQRYRDSYLSIFDTQDRFDEPWTFIFDFDARDWDTAAVAELNAAASTDGPFHQLEMWWWHAVSGVAVPALEQYVGA